MPARHVIPKQVDPSPGTGELWLSSTTANTVKYYDGTTTRPVVDTSLAQTLSNKTLTSVVSLTVDGQTFLKDREGIGPQSGGPASDHMLYVYEINNTTSGTKIGTGSYMPTAPTAVSTANKYGLVGEVLASGSSNQTGTLAGVFVKGQYNGSATASSLSGMRVETKNLSGAGTITSARGIDSYVYTTDAVITTGYGLFGNAPFVYGTGSIGTYYHLYLETPTAAGTNFAIYSVGGNNYLGGNVSIAGGASNGQQWTVSTLSELTTIAAAATTDTAIQIPANAVVFAVSVRVTTVIPTAATFTVKGTTTGTQFDVAGGVSTAANTTDVGTALCPYSNGAAQTIRITPNLVPAANTGRVRVTIHYYQITVPTS